MAERSMTDALTGAISTKPAPQATDLAAKRRTVQEPEINAFIKAGRGAIEPGHATWSAGQAQPDMQLNTKIPADLYQRARRAVFECQMSRTEPRTIQDLVSQALHAELRRLGF